MGTTEDWCVLSSMEERTGGCGCGALRFVATGKPTSVGVCHCLTCQRANGSDYSTFLMFPADRVVMTGPQLAWESSQRYTRVSCARCGSRVFGRSEDEFELMAGAFDEPPPWPPQDEAWTIRRRRWVQPIPTAKQFERRVT